MAQAQISELSIQDMAQLVAAKARSRTQHAKDALARARTEFKQDSVQDDIDRLMTSTGPFDDQTNKFDLPSTGDTPMPDAPVAIDPAQQEVNQIEEARQEMVQDPGKPYPGSQSAIRNAKAEIRDAQKKFESRKNIDTQELQKRLEEIDAENEEAGIGADGQLFVPQNETVEEQLLRLLGEHQMQGAAVFANDLPPRRPAPRRPPASRRRVNRLTAAEVRKSMEVGFEPILEKLQGKNKRNRGKWGSQNAEAYEEPKPQRKGKGAKKTKRAGKIEPPNLRPNVIAEAHESAALPALQGITGTRRQEVIAQIIASIPAGDKEEAKEDAAMINEAAGKFSHRLMQDGKGNWRMKGMTTSIYNYQVLGCAFMRDRENSPDEPRGGILGDVMGIGKTFQALVNIVDGFPTDPEDPVHATLLVVPSHLTKHWMDEMRKHCEKGAIGRVVNHHALAKLDTLDNVEELASYSVVITTYDEIRRSYPTFNPPKELTNEAKLREQWAEIFEENRGPLHRVKWYRIILDEAHMIKNWRSSVSIAVRGLVGQHKWLISGTPVMNSNEEFYPLFSFLDIPGVGKHDQFLSYYCNHELGYERISNMLRAYMCRRTHASRLYARPIISLPDIKETKIVVQFSEAESIIYEAIQQMFMDSMNDLAHEPNFKAAQSRCCLTMILRMRMFCSHPLTVQHILKFLLRRNGTLLRALKGISTKDSTHTADSSAEIVAKIIAVKTNYEGLMKQRRQEQLDQGIKRNILTNNSILAQKYRELIESLHAHEQFWESIDRTTCPNCGLPPEKSVVTSCLHMYCEDCYAEIYARAEEADPTQRPKPICAKCTTQVEEATRYADAVATAPAELPLALTQNKNGHRTSKRKNKTGANGKPDDDDDEDRDWIHACGSKMPSAKLTGIRSLLSDWKSTNKNLKVVIFSQFTDFIRILAGMCKEQDWDYRCLYGEMRIPTRHKNLQEFREKPEISILLVSLHTGGTGLDMTIAHKCILVDLWWNEAVQNQAFCRLLRHGQTQDVECVKIVVEGSIDEYMLELQTEKTEKITSTMGEEVLSKRDTVLGLLKLFADVSEDSSGRLFAQPK